MPAYRVNGKNVLFIHVPKTGGTSIEVFLSGRFDQSFHSESAKFINPYRHWPILERYIPLQHFHGELLSKIFDAKFFDFVFIIVRDPITRLISEYNYSKRLGRLDARLPFSEWSRLMLVIAAHAPAFRSNHFRPQYEFLCHDAKVYRFEDGILSIARDVCLQLGIQAPDTIAHARQSLHELPRIGAGTLERIQRFYEADYQHFDYTIRGQ